MPPNQCGVHFDGFYPEQFGEWEIWTNTMNKKSKGKTVSIETVEGPCEDLINSATDSDLESPQGYDYSVNCYSPYINPGISSYLYCKKLRCIPHHCISIFLIQERKSIKIY